MGWSTHLYGEDELVQARASAVGDVREPKVVEAEDEVAEGALLPAADRESSRDRRALDTRLQLRLAVPARLRRMAAQRRAPSGRQP